MAGWAVDGCVVCRAARDAAANCPAGRGVNDVDG